MAILFPSDEWIKALEVELNNSADYKSAAAKWEGDLTFVITVGAGISEDTYLYMDLWHGECRSANKVTAEEAKKSEFMISGPLPTWRRVIEGKLDPIRALTGRQLKLKGNLLKIMKTPKAAIELVNCSKLVDTEWPAA